MSEIEALGPWFHNVHLPDGRQTRPDSPLGDFPRYKWEALAPHLPEDLCGWTALDIGCNAGFYSVELARRGARVTAMDVDEHYLRQARWVAAELRNVLHQFGEVLAHDASLGDVGRAMAERASRVPRR